MVNGDVGGVDLEATQDINVPGSLSATFLSLLVHTAVTCFHYRNFITYSLEAAHKVTYKSMNHHDARFLVPPATDAGPFPCHTSP